MPVPHHHATPSAPTTPLNVIPTEAAPVAPGVTPPSRGRAEGPLPLAAGLIESSARLFFQALLDRMVASEEWMYVYILASPSGTLYTGVTNNLCRRVREHREKINRGFSARYTCSKLVYFEIHQSPDEAIDREKQIKNGGEKNESD